MAPLMSYDISSPVSVASFPDQQLLGANSDGLLVPQMFEIETGFSNFDNYQQYDDHQVFEPGEDCIGLVPRLAYNNDIHHKLMPAQNWSLQGNQIITKAEESEVKVGRYSAEEKKDRILRYLKKKNQRNFNKTIKYACRKTLADKRVRVRGRFAKNNDQPSEDELVMDTSQNNLSFEDCLQMKYEEDCWLQAAMANLMHSPYC
ncbi:activator of spomin\\x3a\\x3aLUC2 [Striga hermonthica]|uniref:Activator of spomin\x3a\x3aLUC2 n=1 Tax=Striga hermonthica TaxID=68872 RepID=A0A9N7P041_STRHE|nr:activator of spomin\\x3a\\x3aLUC2 [Striga hermonthica]